MNKELVKAMFYATECNMATFLGLRDKDRLEVKRQAVICTQMLIACYANLKELELTDWQLRFRYNRVAKVMSDVENDGHILLRAALKWFNQQLYLTHSTRRGQLRLKDLMR